MVADVMLPANIAVALLVLSVCGTLSAIWGITVVVGALRSQRSVRVAGGEPLTEPRLDAPVWTAAKDRVSQDLLHLVCDQAGASFAALFLTRHGDDCLIVTGVEGAADDLREVELAYRHPLIRYLAAEGEPVEIAEEEPELALPAGTVLFPVRYSGHLIAVLAAGPRRDGRPIPPRSVLLVKKAATE